MNTPFQHIAAPWFHIFKESASQLTDLTWSVANNGPTEAAVRTVRGRKMKTAARLFDEFAAALQFPDYFGENWPAFEECMVDLSWLPAVRYLLVIRDATDVLADEGQSEFGTFIRNLSSIARQWSTPVSLGEPWDRPAKPFHVILHTDTSSLAKLKGRFQMAGESYGEL